MKILLFVVILLSGLRAFAAADFKPLSAFLGEAVSSSEVAGGSLLVLHRGEVVLKRGFGFADMKSKKPFETDTPVVIASISKPLLGTTAFRLSEQGRLQIAGPITDYLPEFADRKLESGVPLKRPPTMLELFTHTSGIRRSEAPGGRPWFASWTKGKQLGEVVKRYAEEFPFEAEPSTRYAYSGIGSDVAARVLEVASKQSRNDLLRTQLEILLFSERQIRNGSYLVSRFREFKKGWSDAYPLLSRQAWKPLGFAGSLGSTKKYLQLIRWLHHQHCPRSRPVVDDDP